MLKKIIIGILLVTVVGAGGTALAYNAVNQDSDNQTEGLDPLASDAGEMDTAIIQQEGQANSDVTGRENENLNNQPWQESGTISGIGEYGFQFQLQNGEELYIELGPPDYWRNQGVELNVGQNATVMGTINEGMIHAEQLILAEGKTLQLRSESGQPMWSGGESVDRGQNTGQGDGEGTPDPQVQVDEWVSVEGTLMAFQGGYMTMSTTDGEILTFQTGQPRFFSSQGITFQVGDDIVVVGYYEDSQFMAGDITQSETGLRVMLRDPNGRPLWAGPGNGNSNGNGNGNQGSGGARNQQ